MLNIYAIKNAIISANKATFQDSSESFLYTSENISVDLNENPDFIKIWYGKIYNNWLEPIIEKDIDRKSDNAKVIALAHKINSHKTCKREKIYDLLSWLSCDNSSNDNKKTTFEDELLALANNIKKVMYTHYQETTKHVVSMQQVDAFARVVLHNITDIIDVIDTDSDGFIDERTSLFEIGLFPEDGVNLYRKLALLSIIALIPIDPRSKDNKKAIRHFSTAYKFLLPEPSSVPPTDSNYLSIDKDAVWNAGKQWYENAKKSGRRFSKLVPDLEILPIASRFAHKEGEEEEQSLLKAINNSFNHLYLIGEGGIGKTTTLFSIMEGAYDNEYPIVIEGIPLFVELSMANSSTAISKGTSNYILRSIQRLFPNSIGNQDDIAKQIIDLFSHKKDKPEYVLLLDGLNEVSREEINGESIVNMLCSEICHIIKYYENVRIILTSRSKEAKLLGNNATLLYLSGIKSETIEKFLRKNKYSTDALNRIKQNTQLMELLQIPLFLTLFSKINGNTDLLTRGEILHTFFAQKKHDPDLYSERNRAKAISKELVCENTKISGVTPAMLNFILDFILPAISWRMVQKASFQFDQEEAKELIDSVLTSYSAIDICGKYGNLCYENYRISSKDYTLTVANTLKQYFKYGSDEKLNNITANICDFLIMQLGVVTSDDYNTFEIIHHHVRDYFAALYHINKLKLAVFLFNDKAQNEDDCRAQARLCLSEWNEQLLPGQVLSFIGEALGEAHNAPYYEITTNRWINAVSSLDETEYPERTLIRKGLEIFRDKTGIFEDNNSKAVWNLFQILKLVRRDLSGEDFSYLDLSICCARGYRLGNKDFGAKLTGSKLTDEFFLPAIFSEPVSADFSFPDGKHIILSLENQTVKVLDSDTFAVLGTLKGLFSNCSPDGKQIVTVSGRKIVYIWDANTFVKLGTIKGEYSRYSPDGKLITTGSGRKTVSIWDAKSFVKLGKIKGHFSQFSPDGKHIVTDSRRKAIVLDSKSFVKLGTLEGEVSQFSPDGKHIFTSSGVKTIVWDANYFVKLGTLDGHFKGYSPDEQQIVTDLGYERLGVWDAKSFVKLGTIEGWRFCYSPDGKQIVTCLLHKESANVWDAKTFVKLGAIEGFFYDYSPDGKHIFTSSGVKTIVWDANYFVKLGTLDGHFKGYSPDKKHIVTISPFEEISIVWDAKTFVKLGTLKGVYLSYSPDKQRIIYVSNDGIATITDANTFKEINTTHINKHSIILAFYSSDSIQIISDSRPGSTEVWNANTFIELGTLDGHFEGYSPDKKHIVTNSGGKNFSIWDTKTLVKLGTIEGINLRYSPDGKHIVTNSEEKVIVWDAKTFVKLGAIEGFFYDYSPDGKHIFTSSGEKTIVWDATAFVKLGTLNGIIYGYSPDEQQIVTDLGYERLGYERLGVWDAKTLVKLGAIEGFFYVYSPDGKHIFTSSGEKTIVWDANYFVKLGTLDGHFKGYSPDEQQIVTDLGYERLGVWDAKSFVKLGTIEGWRFCYSPDGKQIVTCLLHKESSNVWDAKSFVKLETLEGQVSQFSPDGKHIFTSSGEKTIVWDANIFVKLRTIKGRFPKYSPDKLRIITVSGSERLTVWDAKTFVKLGRLEGRCLQYSPDEQHIITVSKDGTANVWDAKTFRKEHKIKNTIGVVVHNVDISSSSNISSDTLNLLKEYGAVIQEDHNKQHSRKVKKRLR